MKRLLVLVGCVVLLAGLAVWFFLGYRSRRQIRNVVLISIDTCLPGYFGCYGCRYKPTPNIDAVAAEGILFENVVTTIPLTLPAHSSMLTGTIPPYHGIHDNLDYRLADSNVTLAEILKDNGFVTGAIIGAFILDSQFGLDQGFDYYNDQFDEELNDIGIAERRGKEVTHYGIEWLDEHKDERFFLFLHYYDPHAPYDPPEPFKSEYVFVNDDVYSLYGAEIGYTDHCIGRVIDKLKSLGIYDSTLIIITGDHGESLGKHSESSHGYFIYNKTIKVPLIFKLPQEHRPRQIDEVVGLIDIVPTVCRLFGIREPSGIQGKDLSRYFKEKVIASEERHLYCEAMTPTKYNCNSLLGIVTNRFKYIQTTRPELYDLVKDPHEVNNLIEQQPQRARILRDRLKQILEETVRKGKSDSRLELDEKGRRHLESLGYVASSVSEDFKFDQTKEDPKDFIEFHNINSAIVVHIHKEEYAEAKILCQKLLEQRPDFARAHFNMSQIAIGEEDRAKALEHLTEFLRLVPDSPDAHNNLAMLLLKEEKSDEAIAHFSKALQLNPDHLFAKNNLGKVFFQQGEFDKAITCWRESLSIKSNQPDIYYNLGMVLIRQGNRDEGVKCYLESLKLKPGRATVYNDLGMAFEQMKKPDEAVICYNKSLRLDPNQAHVHNSLGRLLTRQGRPDQAVDHYAESLKLNPGQVIIRNNIAELYFQQGKNEEAIVHWNKALRIKPDMVSALNNMAWIKAVYESEKLHDPDEAVQLAKHACELTDYERPSLLDTLSIAYAAVGRFDEAVDAAEKAIKLALFSEQDELAAEIKKHLELYKAGKPYRQQP